jgi:hypothetical protein
VLRRYDFNGHHNMSRLSMQFLPTCVHVWQDYVLICDGVNNLIRVAHQDHDFIYTFAGNGTEGFVNWFVPARSMALQSVDGVAVDAIGRVFIADNTAHQVYVANPTSTQCPVGWYYTPGLFAEWCSHECIPGHFCPSGTMWPNLPLCPAGTYGDRSRLPSD